MAKYRIIGDVHGKLADYAKICQSTERYNDSFGEDLRTIQIGDMGFEYGYLACVNPDRHTFFGGDHDNYDVIDDVANYLGDFGEIEPGLFFVRGAASIDKHLRMESVSWWRDEELTTERMYQAFESYSNFKPRVVLTHDCPDVARDHMLESMPAGWPKISTKTGQFLQRLFEVHKPELWVFGHWHKNCSFQIEGVTFTCLGELQTLDIEV